MKNDFNRIKRHFERCVADQSWFFCDEQEIDFSFFPSKKKSKKKKKTDVSSFDRFDDRRCTSPAPSLFCFLFRSTTPTPTRKKNEPKRERNNKKETRRIGSESECASMDVCDSRKWSHWEPTNGGWGYRNVTRRSMSFFGDGGQVGVEPPIDGVAAPAAANRFESIVHRIESSPISAENKKRKGRAKKCRTEKR